MSSLAATTGIYQLAERHLSAVQQLASSPAVAASTRVPHPYPADGARRFFERMQAERAAGTGHAFAIEHRGEVVGVCGLHQIAGGSAEAGYWLGEAFWGRGLATFALQTLLSFAFDNLRLHEVWAEVREDHAASRRVLEKCGFVPGASRAHGEARWPAHVPLVRYALARRRWLEHRAAPALQALHEALRALVAAELRAGNEIRETSRDWPEPGSVFVRLREPFRALPDPLPAGVAYGEPGDPHWWHAELTTQGPRHFVVW